MTDKIVVGDVDWMRNDYLSDIMIGGIEYPSVEHAYQAAKFSDPNTREEIAEARVMKRTRPRSGRRWRTTQTMNCSMLVRTCTTVPRP
jgi:predicted NAD-dependent protein-ADP-ribosyltransferase YbiA (DUF1768 family)